MKTCFVSFTFLFRPRKNLSRSYCKRPIPLRCCRPRTIKLLRSWMYSLAAKYLIRYISPYQVPYTYVFSNSIDTWKPGVTGVSLYDSKIRFERVGNRFANCVHPVMFPRRINRGNACQRFIPRRRKLSSRKGRKKSSPKSRTKRKLRIINCEYVEIIYPSRSVSQSTIFSGSWTKEIYNDWLAKIEK